MVALGRTLTGGILGQFCVAKFCFVRFLDYLARGGATRRVYSNPESSYYVEKGFQLCIPQTPRLEPLKPCKCVTQSLQPSVTSVSVFSVGPLGPPRLSLPLWNLYNLQNLQDALSTAV